MAHTTLNLGGVNIGAGERSAATPTPKDLPFHLLLIGNFSGDSEQAFPKKPIEVDRDNFDEIFSRLSPSLNLSLLNESLTFTDLEHFEPDHLYDSLDLFSQLRSLKRRLSNNDTFASAADEINRWTNAPTENDESEATNNDSETTKHPVNLLDSLLASTEQRQSSAASSQQNIAEQIIKDIIAPYLLPATNPKQAEYIEFSDAAISKEMSKILHAKNFQSLESLWRSLYFLVRRLTTDRSLKIFIANISKKQLEDDLDANDVLSTEFYLKFIEPYNSENTAQPWSLIFAHYQFEDKTKDIEHLKTLSRYGQECQAGFITETSSTFFGCKDLQTVPEYEQWNLPLDTDIAEAWRVLRESPQSNYLTFGFPRFLLRLPYGNMGGTVESFEYEEMPSPVHSDFLWSNGGLAIAYTLAASYSEYQWQFNAGQINEITNLPLYIYTDEYGDKESYPCAEILLTERAGEKIVSAGIAPCWSVKSSDKVRVGPIVSASATRQVLNGRWSG